VQDWLMPSILLRMPFESEEAQKLNKDVLKRFAAMTIGMELWAKEVDRTKRKASPISQGISSSICGG
jgi:ribonucleoside-diphosphate reductase alpha chain